MRQTRSLLPISAGSSSGPPAGGDPQTPRNKAIDLHVTDSDGGTPRGLWITAGFLEEGVPEPVPAEGWQTIAKVSKSM